MVQGTGSRVVLTCGVAGAGKTTFAKQLESAGFVRLSVDDEVRKRLESGVLSPDSDSRLVSIAIEEDIRARLIDLVRHGKDVVVDFSFWKRSARDAYRKIVTDNGGHAELVYFKVDPYAGSERSAVPGSLDQYIPEFEAPSDDENAIVIESLPGRMQ